MNERRYEKDRLRRSMMFVPGNHPGMIADSRIYGADSIMFDLEDSVSLAEKDAARFLVYQALRTLDFGKKEIVVRINDLDSGLGVRDLEAIIPAGVHVVRLPKTDCPQDVIDCEREIARIERAHGIPVGAVGMMAAIESAGGSAGIAALDTVYSDVNNEEGFLAEVELIHKLGFDGKSVINPRQIQPLHRAFVPGEKDLRRAYDVIAAIEKANARGSGVISLNGKMIDRPIVIRARRLIALAEADRIAREE